MLYLPLKFHKKDKVFPKAGGKSLSLLALNGRCQPCQVDELQLPRARHGLNCHDVPPGATSGLNHPHTGLHCPRLDGESHWVLNLPHHEAQVLKAEDEHIHHNGEEPRFCAQQCMPSWIQKHMSTAESLRDNISEG